MGVARISDITKKKALAASESIALANDRRIHPMKASNHRGEPRWDVSEAYVLLQLDMDAGTHLTMKPRELYKTRKEYYENYPLNVFRGHIEQEHRGRNFINYLKKKTA